MRQSNRLILNSLVLLLQQVVNISLQIYLLRFVLLRVGNEEYGIFLLALGAQNLLYTLRDSISKGVVTQVAQAIEKRDAARIGRVVSSAIALQAIPSLTAAIVIACASSSIASWFHVKDALATRMGAVICLTALNILCVMPMFSFRSVLEGLQRYELIAGIEIVSRIVRTVIIVLLFVCYSANVAFVAAAGLVVDISAQVAMRAVAYRLAPTLRVRWRLVDKSVLRTLILFSTFVFLGSLAAVASTEGVKWMIGRLIAVSAVTELGVALYLATVVRMCVQTFTLVMVPVASRLQASDDRAKLRQMFLLSTRYAMVASLLPVVVLWPVLVQVLSLWLRPEFARIAPYTLLIGLCTALSTSSDCGDQILSGVGDARRPFYAIVAGAVATVGTTLLCMEFLERSFAAPVIGICTGLLVRMITMLGYAHRRIVFSGRLWFRYSVLHPFLAVIPAAVVGWVMAHGRSTQSWMGIMLNVSVSGLVFGLAFLPLLLPSERCLLATTLRSVRMRMMRSRGQ